MKLYLRTIEQTLGLFPTKLATILITFRSRPLLEDPEMKELSMFHLDPEKSWLPEEIRNFTPWLRHDVLQKQGVDMAMNSWADSTFDALLSGLKNSLNSIQDPWAVTKLRRELLETWLAHRAKDWGGKGHDRLTKLRSAFINRLEELVSRRAKKLEAVGYRVVTEIKGWQDADEVSRDGLWLASISSITLGIGAVKFKKTILDRLHGHDTKHRGVMKQYASWLKQMQVIVDIIKHIKEVDWDDDLEMEMDESDLESTSAQLREEDPGLIEDSLAKAITSALERLHASLHDTVKLLAPEHQRQQAAFLLRIIRDIRQRLPEAGTTNFFGLSTIPELHGILAESTIQEPIRDLEQQMAAQNPGRLKQIVALWEGTPPSPTQPSPAVFKFLHNLVTAMMEEGGDLWTSAAAGHLKTKVRGYAAKCLATQKSLAGEEEQRKSTVEARSSTGNDQSNDLPATDTKEEDGDEDNEDTDELQVKAKVQTLFDVMFLQQVLAVRGQSDNEDSMDALEGELVGEVEEAIADVEHIRAHVQGFWKRTALLFSLLA